MSFVIQCECGQQMTVEDQHAGQSAMCVNCRRTIQIPERPAVPGEVVMVRPSPGGVPSPPVPTGPGAAGGGWMKPHRAGLVLTLGILGLVFSCCCCGGIFFGLPALILGINDMNEMKAGRMDPAGYSMTMTGAICGGISLALSLFGSLWTPFLGIRGGIPLNEGGFHWPF